PAGERVSVTGEGEARPGKSRCRCQFGLCSKEVDLLLTLSLGPAVLSGASPPRRAEHGTWRIHPGLYRGHHPCRGSAGTPTAGPLAELRPAPLPALRPAVSASQPGTPHLA